MTAFNPAHYRQGDTLRVTVQGKLHGITYNCTNDPKLVLHDGDADITIEWDASEHVPEVTVIETAYRPGDVASYTNDLGKTVSALRMYSGYWITDEGVQLSTHALTGKSGFTVLHRVKES